MPVSTLVGVDLFAALETLPDVCAGLAQSIRRGGERNAVAVHTGEDAVEQARAAWREIEREGGVTSPFQSPAVAEAAARVHLRRGDVPRVVVVSRDGRPRVIFPTVVGHWAGTRTIRFLGDPLIQYGDFIPAADASMADMETAWLAAADPNVASFLHLRKVRSDARVRPLLARFARPLAEAQAPFIALDRPVDRPARDAREMQRYRRRLAESGTLRFDVKRGPSARNGIRAALDLKRAWLNRYGYVSAVVGDPHWEEALMQLADAGELASAELRAGDAFVAVEIGLLRDKRWYAFVGAFDPDFARMGPGHVQMDETVAYCRTHGMQVYDLLPPADPYKQALATGAVAVCDYAAPLRVTGWLGIAAARLVPAAKEALHWLPADLRKRLTRNRPPPR